MLVAIVEILLLASLQVAKSRTIHASSGSKSSTEKPTYLSQAIAKYVETANAKDHANSVLPESETVVTRGGRAISDDVFTNIEVPRRMYRKECNGTNTKLNTRTSDVRRRYRFYRKRYAGCEIVHGNLELVFLHNTNMNYDMSFLKDIREVTGYILIAVVFAKTIPLTSLEVVRGETLFRGSSLYVVLTYSSLQDVVGLWELQMPSLVEISRGDVVFRRNNYLCFMDTIVWGTIMKQPDSRLYRRRNRVGIVRQCGSCAYKCHDHCWGEGDNMCQANPYFYSY